MKRYGPPGSLDTAPHGTICQVDNDNDMHIYIQTNKDEETPHWKLMGAYPLDQQKLKIIEEAQQFKSFKF